MSINDTNRALCKILGIDPENVCEVNITMRPDELPTVRVTRWVLNAPFAKVPQTQMFELRQLGEPHP